MADEAVRQRRNAVREYTLAQPLAVGQLYAALSRRIAPAAVEQSWADVAHRLRDERGGMCVDTCVHARACVRACVRTCMRSRADEEEP